MGAVGALGAGLELGRTGGWRFGCGYRFLCFRLRRFTRAGSTQRCGVNGDLREEIGWPELVDAVAKIRDSLPAGERRAPVSSPGNYGEAGAIDLYGPAHGLPPALSRVNSFWLRGYGDPPPQTLIVVGISRRGLSKRPFRQVRIGGNHLQPLRSGQRRDRGRQVPMGVPGTSGALA